MTTVTEIKAAKTKMEQDIRSAVAQAMSEFRDTTGMSPYAISIGLSEVSSINGARQYVLHEVSARLEL